MPVVQPWYPSIPRTSRGSVVARYWGSLIDVRSRMNLDLWKQEMKTKDPDYLFKRVMALEEQIADAAGRQAQIMVAREQGRWGVIEDTMAGALAVQKAGVDAEARVATAKIDARSRLLEKAKGYNQERLAERTVSAGTERMVQDRLDALGAEAGAGGQPPTQAVAALLQEALTQEKAAPGTEKAAAIAQRVYSLALTQGNSAAAAAVLNDPTYGTGGTPPEQFMRDNYGDILEGAALESFLQQGTAGGVRIPQNDWRQLLGDVAGSVDRMATGGFGPSGAAPEVYVLDEQGQQFAAPATSLRMLPPTARVYTSDGWVPAAQAVTPEGGIDRRVVPVQQQTAAQGSADPVAVMGDRVARLQAERDKYMALYEAARSQEERTGYQMIPGAGLNYMVQQPFHRASRRQGDIDRIVEQGTPERVQWAMDDIARFGPGRAEQEMVRMGGAPAFLPTWANLSGSGKGALGWVQGELVAAEAELSSTDPQDRANGLRRLSSAVRASEHIAPSLGPNGKEWVAGLLEFYKVVTEDFPGDYDSLVATARDLRPGLAKVFSTEGDPVVDFLFAQDLDRALNERDPAQQNLAIQRVAEQWQQLPDTLTGGPTSVVQGFGRAARESIDKGDLRGLVNGMQGARSRALDITDRAMRERSEGPSNPTERGVMNETLQEQAGIARPPSGVPVDRATPAPVAPAAVPVRVQAPAPVPDEDEEAIREVARAANIDPEVMLDRARQTARPGGGYVPVTRPPPSLNVRAPIPDGTRWTVPNDADLQAVLDSMAEPKGR